MLLCVSYHGLVRYSDWYLNWIFTICIWDVSSHIVNVMLYCMISLSFFKYRFDGFRPLSMCSRPYISFFEITGIPTSFSFPKIPYRFRFWWKKCESESGVYHRSFPTVFIPRLYIFRFVPLDRANSECDMEWRQIYIFRKQWRVVVVIQPTLHVHTQIASHICLVYVINYHTPSTL